MPGRTHTDETKARISAGVRARNERKRIEDNPTSRRAKELHDAFQAATPERISPRVRNHGDIGRDIRRFVPPPRQVMPPLTQYDVEAKAAELGMKRGAQLVEEKGGTHSQPRPPRMLTNASQNEQTKLRDQRAKVNANH